MGAYLFEMQSDTQREEETEKSVPDLFPRWLQEAGLVQAKASTPALRSGLSPAWQGPKYLGHQVLLSQACRRGVRSERQLRPEPELWWNVDITLWPGP